MYNGLDVTKLIRRRRKIIVEMKIIVFFKVNLQNYNILI